MKLLIGQGDPATPDGLRSLYQPPRLPWLRANMVTSLDGATRGPDGLSGSISNTPDQRVFDVLRDLADAIVVGSVTAAVEQYAAAEIPIIIVSGRGHVPAHLRDAPPGAVRLGTVATSPGLTDARRALGDDYVYVAGDSVLDVSLLIQQLHRDGLQHLLCEGGPTLLSSLVRAGVVDEICQTTIPRVLNSSSQTLLPDLPEDVPLSLTSLLEDNGTLLYRWHL